MLFFEWLLVLLFGAVLLALAARRIGVPYPTLLAVGGAALAFVPGMPSFELDPELALALFVAPVLLDAAFDTSLRDLKDNWRPITGLVLVAVGATTAVVAFVAHALVPDMPWAAAVALGAIVAPPDAAAATAVLRQLRPPHRILVVLEGESLLNDASALLIYRLAVTTVAAGSLTFADAAPTFVLVVIGSVIAGYVLAKVYQRLLARISDSPSAIILQFVGAFGVWLLAERLSLSGIVTIVTFAMTLARRAPEQTPARLRVPSYAVWETATFVLNVLAFTLIGLQTGPILSRLSSAERIAYAEVVLAVLASVILVRIVWAMSYNTVVRVWIAWHGFHPKRPMMVPTVRSGLIVSWCGMRGIVTLAAALALPTGSGGEPSFPYRDLIVVTAFAVVLGTLLIQGLTLGPLLRWLDLHDDDPVGREVRLGRTAGLRAALAALDGENSPEAEILRREYSLVLDQTAAGSTSPRDGTGSELRRRTVDAARNTIIGLRTDDQIGDTAFQHLEQELDWLELSATGAE